MVGVASRNGIPVAILFTGGHRSVIMNINNGKVLSSLVKLIQNGTEKVSLPLTIHMYLHTRCFCRLNLRPVWLSEI